jgi:imidazole glycerol-phosphate synthase subunit HisF
MLKKRIIPKLLVDSLQTEPTLVTTRDYAARRVAGSPVSQARVYSAQGADELSFINLGGRAGFSRFLAILEQSARELFMPLAAGGGVSSVDDARALLVAGADKIVINTAATENPCIISEMAERFGSQSVLISVDYRTPLEGEPNVFVDSGRRDSGIKVTDWVNQCERLGAGEIMLNCITRDGSSSGYDLLWIDKVRRVTTLPLIVSCGCGSIAHFIEAFATTGVSAAAAGTFFAFHDQNPIQARAMMKNAGVPMRRLY